jgi:hypothetical protein
MFVTLIPAFKEQCLRDLPYGHRKVADKLMRDGGSRRIAFSS